MADVWGVLPVAVFVGDVQPDSPAAANGVQPDDRIWSVDGTVVRTWFDLTRLVATTAKGLKEGENPRALALVVIRDGKSVPISLEPRMETDVAGGTVSRRPVMGIHQYPKAFVAGDEVKKYYGITEAIPRAARETAYLTTATVAMLGHIFTGQVPAKDSIGGPIEIFRMAGQGAERGIYSYVRLIGTISISLGIFNLLPVPVLDGGQIMFYAIEGIRGRPLSLAVREKLQMAGVLALVALMLVVAVLDINRLVTAAPERR
jgi:regulator of sigma E protease